MRFADLPMIEGATGKFLLQKMAAVAEVEAGTVSARPKTALAAAKRRGVSLRAIAAALEECGIPAARGGKWSAVQVSRLLEAARSPFDASAVAAVA